MKKSIFLGIVGLMFSATILYAAGDMVIGGSLGVGTGDQYWSGPQRQFQIYGTSEAPFATIGQKFYKDRLGWSHYISSSSTNTALNGNLTIREYTSEDWTTGYDRVTFKRGGNVGIGVSNPLATLATYTTGTYNPYVATGLKTVTIGNISTANGGWRFNGICSGGVSGSSATPACLAADYGYWYFGYQSDTNTINTTAFLTPTGNLWVAGTVIPNGSDINLKTDIQDVRDVLMKLKQARAVSYKWKNPAKSQARQIGVIAQEIESLFPELVQEMENPDCKDSATECTMPTIKVVDYIKLSTVAMQGVKELSDKVDDLEKRIEKLEKIIANQNTNQ